MSRTTTTLLEILISELTHDGHNEFFNNNQLTFFNDKFSYMKKAMMYDADVEKIVNEKFFMGLSLSISDKEFKRMFLNRFLNREITTQTIELFATQVSYNFMAERRYLESLYTNFDKFVTNEHVSQGNNKNNSEHNNRNAYQDLPQDEVNIDLNDDTFNFASNNTISKDKTVSTQDNLNTSQDYNIDNLLKLNELLNKVLDVFDKNCFLQVFS